MSIYFTKRRIWGRSFFLLIILIIFFTLNNYTQDSTYIIWDAPQHFYNQWLDTSGCSIQWQPAQNISYDPIDSYSPRIAALGDTLHATWVAGVQYTRSIDAGKTWEPPHQLVPPGYNDGLGGWVVALPGKTCVFWATGWRYPPHLDSLIWMIESSDGGATWGEKRGLTKGFAFRQALAVGDTIALFFVDLQWKQRVMYSTDRGETWEIVATILPDRSFSSFALSREWMHMVYQPLGLGTAEVGYRRSSDLGVTWSDSLILSSRDGIVSDEMWIVSDDSGGVYVAWRDGKYGCPTGIGCHILFRRSTDHGASWLTELILTDVREGGVPHVAVEGSFLAVVWYTDTNNPPTHGHVKIRTSTNRGEIWCSVVDMTPTSTSARYPFAAISNGRVHVVHWDRPTSNADIFHIRGDISITGVQENTPSQGKRFAMLNNFPNPFNQLSTVVFDLQKTGRVRLLVYDILGRERKVLLDEARPVGRHEIVFDAAGYAAGVYFLLLQTVSGKEVKPVMLLK